MKILRILTIIVSVLILSYPLNAKKKESSKPSASSCPQPWKDKEPHKNLKARNEPKNAGPNGTTQSPAIRREDEKKPTYSKQKKSSVAIPTEELEFT